MINKKFVGTFTIGVFLPGSGYFINKEHKKFAAVIIAMLGILVAFDIWAGQASISAHGKITILQVAIIFTNLIGIIAAYNAASTFRDKKITKLPLYIVLLPIVYSALYFLGSQVINHLPIGTYKMPTTSMEPTIKMEEGFIADRNAYKNKNPERGDVIVFNSPESDIQLSKRIIGMPGDVISIIGHDLFINEKPIKEPYVKYTTENGSDASFNVYSKKISENSYFVLGDNRDNSYDSRMFGEINLEAIKGKAIVKYEFVLFSTELIQ